MSCHHSHTPPRTKEYSVFSGPLERLKGKTSVFHHMAIHPIKPYQNQAVSNLVTLLNSDDIIVRIVRPEMINGFITYSRWQRYCSFQAADD